MLNDYGFTLACNALDATELPWRVVRTDWWEPPGGAVRSQPKCEKEKIFYRYTLQAWARQSRISNHNTKSATRSTAALVPLPTCSSAARRLRVVRRSTKSG